MTAFASAQWLRSHLINLVSNEPTCLNSITNDTCSTMFSMWGEIKKFPEFKHVFFVPCDSHGLQLFVKDLLKTPRFENIIQQAQSLISAFKKAPLQYARLRKLQSDCYGHEQSLVLSVIMRWGTQYQLVQSILKSKDALKRYVCDYEEFPASQRIKQPVIGTIRSTTFWHELELLREVLQPIDEHLKTGLAIGRVNPISRPDPDRDFRYRI